MPDSATELLDTVRRMAETQSQMARRQIAMEQLFERVRSDLERWQVQIDQSAGYAAKIAVLEYQRSEDRSLIEQLFAAQRTQGTRLLLLLIPILVNLGIWAVLVVISLTR